MANSIDTFLGHIKVIREEANGVKDCFTKFSFQSIAFYSVIIVAVIRYQEKFPIISFALLLSSLFMLVVSRIGTYKYTTANRNYGFELYLRRALVLNGVQLMSWEDALRAWRIVQPTIFHSLYETDGFFNKFRPKTIAKYPCSKKWFNLKSLISKKSNYYAGGYLRTMMNVHKLLAIVGLFPFSFPLLNHLNFENEINILSDITYLHWILLIVGILNILYIVFWYRVRYRVLNLLESGILSIFSSAILWQAIGVCHYLALKDNNNSIVEYTKQLSILGEKIAEKPDCLPDWLAEKEEEFKFVRINIETLRSTT